MELMEKIKGEITLDKVINLALKTPGVKINRKDFLKRELENHCTEQQLQKAIEYNPAKAGINRDLINRISKSVIDYETKMVTGISIAASLPSSINATIAVGAASADITSFFAFILRVVQKLAYLYGFEEFNLNEDGMDSETMDYVLVFIGVMFGVQGANAALQKLCACIAAQVSKKLAQQALTKGVVYPIVRKVATSVGIHMTKQVFADTVASAIPVVGSLASGGLTYFMFKPCCYKLRESLKKTNLSDPVFYETQKEKVVIDV